MARIKGAMMTRKRRKKTLKLAKAFSGAGPFAVNTKRRPCVRARGRCSFFIYSAFLAVSTRAAKPA